MARGGKVGTSFKGKGKFRKKMTGKPSSGASVPKVEKVEKLTKPKTDRQLMQFGEGGGVCRGMGRAYMGEPRKVKIR